MGFFSDTFGGGASRASARAERVAGTAAKFVSQEQEAQSKILEQAFQNVYTRLIAEQSPFLASIMGLEPEFRAAPGRAITPSLLASNVLARKAGGGRGQAFSALAPTLAARAGVEAGGNLAGAQLQALQNIAALREFGANLALPARTAFLQQHLGGLQNLSSQTLAGIANIRSQGVAGVSAISAQSVVPGFGASFGRALGSTLGTQLGAFVNPSGGINPGGGGGGGSGLEFLKYYGST